MKRWAVAVLSLVVLAAPLAVEAPAGNTPRIGFLGQASPSASSHLLTGFRQRLNALGWVEGQNIVLEERWAEGRLDRLPALAAELVRLKVAVLLVGNAATALAAKQATATIPIVMGDVPDPVGVGLVASLSRPGATVTGSSCSDTSRPCTRPSAMRIEGRQRSSLTGATATDESEKST